MKEKNGSIIGTSVILRPITMQDTHLIVKWRNRDHVRQNFIFRETFTAEMHENWMNTRVASGEVVQYIIEEKNSRVPVGSVYLRDIDMMHKHGEFGIFIGEESALGKGYGSEAAYLFVNFCLCGLGLHRISLRVLGKNAAAYRSYEKAGFKLEGVAKDMVFLDGKYQDVVFMAITAE